MKLLLPATCKLLLFVKCRKCIFCLLLIISLMSLNSCTSLERENKNDPGSNYYTEYFSVGGTLTGLQGSLTLQLNGSVNLKMTKPDDFVFEKKLADGTDYIVTVYMQPEFQICAVKNGKGKLKGENITNVKITCAETLYDVSGSVIGLVLALDMLQKCGHLPIQVRNRIKFC